MYSGYGSLKAAGALSGSGGGGGSGGRASPASTSSAPSLNFLATFDPPATFEELDAPLDGEGLVALQTTRPQRWIK